LLLEPPVLPPPEGSDKGPSSPGDTIDVSPPPPQDASKNIDVINNEFLIELVNINYSPPWNIGLLDSSCEKLKRRKC
jgi:hypothetical protein